MEVRYYCFQSCTAMTSDFNTKIQLFPTATKKYILVKETKDYVFIKYCGQEIVVKTDTFLDNFKVTRV